MGYTKRMRKIVGITPLVYIAYVLGGQFIHPSLVHAQITAGCHAPTASEIADFTVLDQKAPAQICGKDISMVTGGCDTSPYPFLLQHYKPGAASSAAGTKGITMLNADFACRLSKYIKANPQINIISAYRSPDTQATLFNAAVQKYGSTAAARKWVAPPPCAAETNAVTCGKGSNHNKGLAADLSNMTPALQAAASQYQLHFPMSYEKWHIEPSGTVNSKPVTPGDDDGAGSNPGDTTGDSGSCTSLYCQQECQPGQQVISTSPLVCAQTPVNQCPPGQAIYQSGPPVVCAQITTSQQNQCPPGQTVYQSGPPVVCVPIANTQQNQCPQGSVFSNGTCYPLNNTPGAGSSPSSSGSPSSSASPSSVGSTGSAGTQPGISSILSGITSGNLPPTSTSSQATTPSVSSQLYGLIQTSSTNTTGNTSDTGGTIALNSDNSQVSELNPFSQSLSGVSSDSNSVSTPGQGTASESTNNSPVQSSSSVIHSTQPAPGSQTFTSTDLRGNTSDTYSSSGGSNSFVQNTQALLTDLRNKLVNALTYLRKVIAGR
jgi:hypothetical protein